jgi:hypothetical protein
VHTTTGPWGWLFGEAGRVVVQHDDDDEGTREEQRTRRGRGEALRLRSSADGECEPEVERSSAGRKERRLRGRGAGETGLPGTGEPGARERPALVRTASEAPRLGVDGNVVRVRHRTTQRD